MGDATTGLPWHALGAVLIASIAISAGLIVLLRPLLLRYALARPNARSSHTQPTPQGGGIAVLLGMACALVLAPASFELYGVFALALAVAIVGAADDIRALGASPRLLVQAAIVIGVVALLPDSLRVFSALPW